MPDMFGKYDEGSGQDRKDRCQVELRERKGGQGEERSFFYLFKLYESEEPSDHVTGDETDQDRDDLHKPAEQHIAQDDDRQGQDRDGHVTWIGGPVHGRVQIIRADPSCHLRGYRHELETDQRDNGSHRGRREDDIDPLRADGFDQQGEEGEDGAYDDEGSEHLRIVCCGIITKDQ